MTTLQGKFSHWVGGHGRTYGFIDGDDGVSYFLHVSECRKAGTKVPDPNDRISFVGEKGEKGYFAVDPAFIT
jgi:cold shock CspA family protein